MAVLIPRREQIAELIYLDSVTNETAEVGTFPLIVCAIESGQFSMPDGSQTALSKWLTKQLALLRDSSTTIGGGVFGSLIASLNIGDGKATILPVVSEGDTVLTLVANVPAGVSVALLWGGPHSVPGGVWLPAGIGANLNVGPAFQVGAAIPLTTAASNQPPAKIAELDLPAGGASSQSVVVTATFTAVFSTTTESPPPDPNVNALAVAIVRDDTETVVQTLHGALIQVAQTITVTGRVTVDAGAPASKLQLYVTPVNPGKGDVTNWIIQPEGLGGLSELVATGVVGV